PRRTPSRCLAKAHRKPSRGSSWTGHASHFSPAQLDLKLKIDGRDNWPGYNFAWAVGSTHSASAPQQQTDANGRSYVFRSWSNGGAGSQDITVTPDAVVAGLRLTAIYEILSKVAVQTSPAGLTVSVDGSACKTPCTIEQPVGSQLRLSAPG